MAKSSARRGAVGMGERIWQWMQKRVARNRDSFVETLGKHLPRYVDPSPDGPCMEWQGTRNKAGYGELGVRIDGRKKRTLYAHQVMWTLFNRRAIPDTHEVGHTCDNAPCVNPYHLELMTRKEDRKSVV